MGNESSKSARVRVLLTTTEYGPREIAELAQCSYQLVTHQRRRLRLPHRRQSIESRLSFAEQAIRELRSQVQTLRRRDDEKHAKPARSRLLKLA